MADRATVEPSRAARASDFGSFVQSGLWLPQDPSEAPAPTPQSPLSEGMTCLAHSVWTFYDPGFGPVSLILTVWRKLLADEPNYEVVVE